MKKQKNLPKIVIGALVGMGPNSTAPFYDSVMDYARKHYGAKHDIDFPEMVLISLPTPFVPGKELNHQEMVSILTGAIRKLNLLQVNYIVVPCNIVHRYYAEMQAVSNVPILNVIDIAVNELKNRPAGKVALIGTEGTINSGLYQNQILQRRNFQIFHTRELQAKVNELLIELKANRLSEAAKSYWLSLVSLLESNACKYGIIACTDISSCLNFHIGMIHFVDSMDMLARITIEKYIYMRNYAHR